MFNYHQYGSAFLDMRLHKLRVLITEQTDELFIERGLTAPSSCISVMLYLLDQKHASIAQIADGLGYSHQLIAHRLKKLENMGTIVKVTDIRDRRKCLIKLSPKGLEEAEKVRKLVPQISGIFDQLFSHMNVDLSLKVDEIRGELTMSSLLERSEEKLPANQNIHDRS